MNYAYFYLGEVPDYVTFSLNSILSVDKDAEIFFCSNKSLSYKNVNYINIEDIESDLTKAIKNLNIYDETSYDPKINKLWITSLLRIFYLRDFMFFNKKESFVHFDVDVMIYKEFSALEEVFDKNRLNITEFNKDFPIFGYSFIPSFENFNKICNKIYDFLSSEEYISEDYYKRHPLNEMQILGIIKKNNEELFNILPSLPYEKSRFLFDPSTYGQYFDGTHESPKKFYKKRKAIPSHKVGQEISSKRIIPKFVNRKPFITHKENTYEIVNLHFHSKRLKNFLPNGYKTYTE